MGQGPDQVNRGVSYTGDSYDADTATYRANDIPTTDAPGEDTAEIRADIEQTRAEMSETIEAIAERLNPTNIKEQVKEQVVEQAREVRDNVREATIGRAEDMVRNAGETVSEARYTLMETIRQNPIPAALTGIGLGWLWMNRKSGSSYRQPQFSDQRSYSYSGTPYQSSTSYSYDYGRGGYQDQGRVGQVVDRAQDMAGQARGTASSAVSQARDTAGNAVSQVADTAGNAASQVRDTAANVANQAQDTAGRVVDQVQETAEQAYYRAQYQAQRLEDRFQQSLRTNPLGVGAVALALGAAAGLALPETQRENELLGETRDRLVERATDVAQNTMEKVQQVAGQVTQEAQSTAKEAARDQGLTS